MTGWLEKNVFVRQEVIDSILSYARMNHPRECILLLRGRVDEGKIKVESVQIPPIAAHGESVSSFPLHRLPMDFSVLGTAHSHPSGVLRPSIEDLNRFYGRIMIITAYPYHSEKDIIVLNCNGNVLQYDRLG